MPSVNPELLDIILQTLRVSGTALAIATIFGLAIGFIVVLNEFPGKKFTITLINTGMGLPPVVVGLVVLLLFWRQGPFGILEWIYTSKVMIIAQVALATPIIAGLSIASLQHISQKLRWQASVLGARGWNLIWLLACETRYSLLAAVMAGFGGIISEVGAVMIVGGNIKGQTRVLTTAIVLEAQKGELSTALQLGAVLLLLSFSVNMILTVMQQHRRSQ